MAESDSPSSPAPRRLHALNVNIKTGPATKPNQRGRKKFNPIDMCIYHTITSQPRLEHRHTTKNFQITEPNDLLAPGSQIGKKNPGHPCNAPPSCQTLYPIRIRPNLHHHIVWLNSLFFWITPFSTWKHMRGWYESIGGQAGKMLAPDPAHCFWFIVLIFGQPKFALFCNDIENLNTG